MIEILQVPATISKIQTMSNRSLRIITDTQENLTDQQMMQITSMYEKLGWFNFAPEQRKIQADDLLNLPELPNDDPKTPSQRLRGRLYTYYSKTHVDTKGFENFYRSELEKFGNRYLEKLN